MTKFKKFRRILAGVLCCAMAFSCMSVAAFAMDDMTEPNSGLVEDNHESEIGRASCRERVSSYV